MAGKQKFLTDEQALSYLTDAVQALKIVLTGLPDAGAYASLKVSCRQAVNHIKDAMDRTVAKI